MYTDYKREFPEFKKNLEHATATGVVKSFSDKPKKLLKLFGRVIERQGWVSDGRLKTLVDEAFKALNNVHFSKEKKTQKFKEKYQPVKARYNAILKENAPKPAAPKQEAPKPEARKPEVRKPEAPKQEAPKPAAAPQEVPEHGRYIFLDRNFPNLASWEKCALHYRSNHLLGDNKMPVELGIGTYMNNLSFVGITGHFSKDNRVLAQIPQDMTELAKLRNMALAKLKSAFYVESFPEIKTQYRKLALLLHPDRTKEFSEDTRKYLEELFVFVNHYYALAGQ